MARANRPSSSRIVLAALLTAWVPAAAWPDGNVTAVVRNGDLVIRGDAASNQFAVVLGSEAGTLEMGGFDETTTTNGSTEVFVARGVSGDLRIALGGGNDQLNVVDVQVPGSLSIRTGAGDDTIGVDDSSPGGDVEVDTGSGNDSFSMNSGAQDFRLDTGAGGDALFLDGVTIGGRATVGAGSGNDDVLVFASTFEGRIELEIAAGDDLLTIQDSNFEDRTTLDGGGGADTLTHQEPLSRFNGPLVVTSFETIQQVPE